MRADIVVARTATALAAWHGRPVVTESDVRDAVRLALPHRRRRDPFDAPGLPEEALDQAMRDAAPPEDPDDDPGGGAPEPSEGGGPSGGESVATPDAPYRARLLSVPGSRAGVALIPSGGGDPEVPLPPTGSHEIGAARLRELPTGGRPPLAAGLTTAARVVSAQRRRDPQRRPLVILVTDGRATAGPDPVTVAPALAGVACVVVDCESGPVRLGLAGRLAGALRAECLHLEQLSADGLRAVVTGKAA